MEIVAACVAIGLYLATYPVAKFEFKYRPRSVLDQPPLMLGERAFRFRECRKWYVLLVWIFMVFSFVRVHEFGWIVSLVLIAIYLLWSRKIDSHYQVLEVYEMANSLLSSKSIIKKEIRDLIDEYYAREDERALHTLLFSQDVEPEKIDSTIEFSMKEVRSRVTGKPKPLFGRH